MKSYPTIPGSSQAPHKPCIAFVKYDGSNLRWEWSRKKGWWKFGTRKRLFDATDRTFGEAPNLFLNKVAPLIEKVIGKAKELRGSPAITVFTEFLDPHSFAGQHRTGEPKELRLIDVCVYKQGILGPRLFLDLFGHLPFVAEVVYEGNLNKQFVEDVREGRYDVDEGVVCKGGHGHKLWMCKIKTNAYREKLKRLYGEGWTEYWE